MKPVTRERFPPEEILRNYFHAKDENRPHVLDATFEVDAVLEIQNPGTDMSFPAVTRGRSGIADVLVRTFCQTYENIYSFYLQRPNGLLREFECCWLVAMTEKATRAVRVGCGRYQWTFGEEPPGLASSLLITISAMQVLPAARMADVFGWIAGLNYPWASAQEALAHAPALPELRRVFEHLAAGEGCT